MLIFVSSSFEAEDICWDLLKISNDCSREFNKSEKPLHLHSMATSSVTPILMQGKDSPSSTEIVGLWVRPAFDIYKFAPFVLLVC